MSTEIKELVDKAVKQHKIAIFGKSWCPVSCSHPHDRVEHGLTLWQYCKTAKGIAERTVKDPSDMEYIE